MTKTMEAVALYKSDQASICLFPQEHILELEWHDFASGDAFRTVLEEAYELAKSYAVKGWLGNNTAMRTIRQVDQQWTTETWFPKLEDLPLRKMAIIESTDAMNRMSVTTIMTTAKPIISFDVQYFTSRHTAMQWLKQ